MHVDIDPDVVIRIGVVRWGTTSACYARGVQFTVGVNHEYNVKSVVAPVAHREKALETREHYRRTSLGDR